MSSVGSPLRRLAPWLAAVLLCCGCPPGDRGAPANASGPGLLDAPRNGRDLLLITVDTLRHDGTGFASAGRLDTPAADRLAAGGLSFTFAHAHAPITLPSHASILTGLYPYGHGMRDNGGYVLDPAVADLGSLLRDAGYRTAAFVSAYPLDRRFGLAKGFEVYDDEYDGYARPGFSPPERPGDETVSRALAWWRQHRGAPRFLWVHVFTPHFPYDAPDPYRARHADQPYWADVELADAELAPLIDEALGEDESAPLIVYTSDHGEALGDHGEQTHSLFAYEATLRVPLVLHARGLIAPGSTDAPARHVDILPTVLQLLDVEAPSDLDGRSLFAAPSGDDGSYFEALATHLNRGWAPLHGRIEERTKAIDLPIPELYDLALDPEETNNLAEREPDRLERILAAIPDEARTLGARATLSAAQRRKLESLGYAAASAPDMPDRFDESTDPKNLVRFDQLLDAALTRYHAGDDAEAIRLLEGLIAAQPSLALAYSHLAFIHTDLGRVDRAIAVLAGAVERGVANESIRRKLALNLVRAGDADRAWQVLQDDLDSAEPETQSALGRVAAMRGDAAEARTRFGRALEIDETFPVAHLDLGTLLMTEGRFAEARPSIERALEQDPFLAEGWNALGAIRSQTRDVPGAIAAWRRAVEIDPRLGDAWFNLALFLGRSGDRAGAAAALERYIPLVSGAERQRAVAMLDQLRAADG